MVWQRSQYLRHNTAKRLPETSSLHRTASVGTPHTSHLVSALRCSNEKPQPSRWRPLVNSAGCGLPQITLPRICNSTAPLGQYRLTSARNCLSNALAAFASIRLRERPLRAWKDSIYSSTDWRNDTGAVIRMPTCWKRPRAVSSWVTVSML